MARCVTILIGDEVDRRVREHRAEKMLGGNKACSYSAAVNDLLARAVSTYYRTARFRLELINYVNKKTVLLHTNL